MVFLLAGKRERTETMMTYSISQFDDFTRAYIFPQNAPEQIVKTIDRDTNQQAARAAVRWIETEYDQNTVKAF